LAAADRILVLQDGKIVVDRPRDQIIFETQPHEVAV
jgi:hypothetical protein